MPFHLAGPFIRVAEEKIGHAYRQAILARDPHDARLAGLARHAVAIADNGTGDKLLFLREGRLYQPEVYVWLHDTGDLIVVA